jgi:hypothetical protein
MLPKWKHFGSFHDAEKFEAARALKPPVHHLSKNQWDVEIIRFDFA